MAGTAASVVAACMLVVQQYGIFHLIEIGLQTMQVEDHRNVTRRVDDCKTNARQLHYSPHCLEPPSNFVTNAKLHSARFTVYAHITSMKHLCMLDTETILQPFADFFRPTQPTQQFLRALRKATRRLAV